MNDGRIDSAAAVLEIIDRTYVDFMNAPGCDAWLEMDGHTLDSDIGYAAEGVAFIVERLKERIAKGFEMSNEGRPYVYVVTAQNDTKEPVVTVYNNEDAARRCHEVFTKMYDRAWIDRAPLYSEFLSDAG